jgi:ribonucleoside-diphosphate reductase alpha subunit
MKIKKRDGGLENLSFDKIVYRLKKLQNDKSLGQLKAIDIDIVAQKVVSTIYDGVSSTELDEEAARIAISMTENLEFSKLATRLVISNMHKNTTECFSEVMEKLYNNVDTNDNPAPVLADDIISLVRKYKDTLNETIDYSRDYLFDYFGFKTLEKSYLMKLNGKVLERPQHLYMRVAIQVHKDSIEDIVKTYHLISQHYFTFASPTLFNAGSRLQNLSSCFLIGTDDSIGGIYKTISDCAQISKVGGGIGVHINNIRSKGSVIRGTNGHSDGIIPMLKVYNSTCLYVNQCLLPHIPVFSKDGIKRMDEITTNDYLVTHDGSYKKVNEVIVSKKKEEILEINIACGIEPLKCTKIHDIYTIKSNRTNGKARLISQLERGIKKPEFIEAEKLTINDYVGFPIPKFEEDNVNWSLEKCRLYGIMLGDGNITFSKTGHRYQITLNNDSKLETKAFVIEQLLKSNIHYWITNDCEICWAYNDVSIQKIGITDKMLYDKNHDKYCVPEVLHLPKNKIAMIMKGLMESDGYKTNTGVFFSSTSKNLIQSLRYICLRFGMLTNCQTVDKVGQIISQNKKGKDIISRKIAYYLRLPKIQLLKDYKIIDGFENTNAYNYFEFEGILYCRIKSINKINYEGEVYDFNMIDNHNYLTDMGLVHNSGKRKGSFAMYLSPEHPDIFEFLDLRKNQGSEDMRARDLFLAMWLSDLFMKQVEKDGDWYLMDPDECPRLSDCYGEEYEELYWKYVEQGKFKRKVKAQEIWMKILDSQIETGTPYILYKDKCNQMSNQKNIGTIKSSNLCSEILLYSDHQEYAVCNLASIALPKFVEIDPETKSPVYNHEKLFEIAKHIVLPMNNVIDFNHYPVPETKKSNLAHRPIGVGIQGLSNTYIKMRLPFESDEAKKLNKEIFETIYFALLTGSMEMAKKDGSYSTFKGSPMSEGKLQFDLWADHNGIDLSEYLSGRWDWESLRSQIKEHGVRNSTLTTCMPTASSAQIMGNTESFECFDSCIFTRRVLSGEYIIINKHLVEDLTRLKLWDKNVKDLIIANNGSVQNIDIIPDDIKALYKTVWEITMKNFIDQSAQRGPFIDMTQSLNLFMASPTIKKLTSMHFYAWKQGLKTGIYYLRSKASSSASKFTIDPNMEKKIKEKQKKGKSLTKKEEEVVLMCSIENKEDCMMCTS